MKTLLIILSIFAMCAFFLHNANNQRQIGDDYQSWKSEYNMLFSQEEDSYRRMIFNENKKRIEIENRLQNNYELGLNSFSGLTDMEFANIYLTRLSPDSGNDVSVPEQYPPLQVNENVDWRDKGAVTDIKNQGSCGSCWAFSATGNLEGVNFIFSGGELNSFSEQQFVDCTKKYGNMGCNGGLEYYAWAYVKDKGVALEEDYPYVGRDQACKKEGGEYKISNIKHVKKGDCNGVLEFGKVNPTSVGVDASRWSSYKKGVFDNCGKNLNHSVLLVGYTSEFYIVKNSWGKNWGEQGYIRLALGNTCGICDDSSTSVA